VYHSLPYIQLKISHLPENVLWNNNIYGKFVPVDSVERTLFFFCAVYASVILLYT